MNPLQQIKQIKERLNMLPVIMQQLTSLQAAQSEDIHRRLEYLQEAIGRLESRQLEQLGSTDLEANEFRVFSQGGEDGIIQFLLRRINIKNKTFVEFGVQDFTEANTRFLLRRNNWRGLIMDGSRDNIIRIKQDPFYWFYNIKAVEAFITKENINQLLVDNGVEGEIGILSIDIDGNDYWVWEAISVVDPIVVIIEYNHRYGPNAAVTVPYDAKFDRATAHYSMIYFGASLKALCLLAEAKGYAFIGCSQSGVNAFFIRKDHKPPDIAEVSPEQGYIAGQFSEARPAPGSNVDFSVSPEEEQLILWKLPLVNVSP